MPICLYIWLHHLYFELIEYHPDLAVSATAARLSGTLAWIICLVRLKASLPSSPLPRYLWMRFGHTELQRIARAWGWKEKRERKTESTGGKGSMWGKIACLTWTYNIKLIKKSNERTSNSQLLTGVEWVHNYTQTKQNIIDKRKIN